ncbi:cupin domain-containing protein [Nocardioides coralli]|uniref:cupin domain-containing protein n=1 Tax=Nocardioides coralli TaxID=2872154 RepID=UPI001CA3A784|nr:cupin domain-containing protein [Nocardioides coralli]QZY28880.1 cupin domain-containing protein [Nocardioides coralli]
MTRRVLGPRDGLVLGPKAGVRDRFLVDSADWGGNLAVVEHLLAPHAIAAPLHRHTQEDEFSLILEGRVWFLAEGQEVVAGVGDLVFKPRHEWHTFWNAGDEPARVLELITPGGLEEAFKVLDTATDEVDLDAFMAPYGCEADMAATLPLLERYGLTFG